MQPPFSCYVGTGFTLSVGWKGETCIRRGSSLPPYRVVGVAPDPDTFRTPLVGVQPFGQGATSPPEA